MKMMDGDFLEEFGRSYLIADRCSLSRQIIDSQLDSQRVFLEAVERAISDAEHAEHAQVLRQGSDVIDEAKRDAFLAEHYPWHWEQTVLPRFRAAFLISLSSSLEFCLDLICRDTKAIVRAPIYQENLKGNCIERAKLYLTSFGNFKTPDEDLWRLTRSIYNIRNIMVHNSGLIENKKDEELLKGLKKRTPGLSLDQGHVEVGREFCEYALNTVAELFSALYKEVVRLCESWGAPQAVS